MLTLPPTSRRHRSAAVLRRIGCCVCVALGLSAGPPGRGEVEHLPVAPAGLLDLIAQCESSGDPAAVNVSASETHWDGRVGSYGLYQFGSGTWDDIARRAWRAGLVEVDWSHGYPHHAPPAAQTRLAEILWDDGRGWRHWRACSEQHGWPPQTPADMPPRQPPDRQPDLPL